jgi:hypothetical protein
VRRLGFGCAASDGEGGRWGEVVGSIDKEEVVVGSRFVRTHEVREGAWAKNTKPSVSCSVSAVPRPTAKEGDGERWWVA